MIWDIRLAWDFAQGRTHTCTAACRDGQHRLLNYYDPVAHPDLASVRAEADRLLAGAGWRVARIDPAPEAPEQAASLPPWEASDPLSFFHRTRMTAACWQYLEPVP